MESTEKIPKIITTMEEDGNIPTVTTLSAKWDKFLQSSSEGPEEAKRVHFDDAITWLLSSYLSASKIDQLKILEFRDPKEIANIVAQGFIASTYEKCSDCDDDGQQFFDFVTQGSGMTMLLLLELYSDKVTSCCSEMCNLLFTILPLAFEEADGERKDNVRQIVLCDVSATANPLQKLRIVLKDFLVGSLSGDGENITSADTASDAVNLNDVKIVCEMLHRERLEKNDLLICVASSLLGILSSDMLQNDFSLQNDVANKLINLLTSTHKMNSQLHLQFSVILSLAVVLLINVMSNSKRHTLVDNTASEGLMAFGTSLMKSAGDTKDMTQKKFILRHISDIIVAGYSLLYWEITTCKSSLNDVTFVCKRFASSELLKLTEQFIRMLLAMNSLDKQPGSATSEHSKDNFHVSSMEMLRILLSKISKTVRKLTRKNLCMFSTDVSHTHSSKRRQSSGTRRSTPKRDQKSSSDSGKESGVEKFERIDESNGSDSTQNMSDYVFRASDSDDSRPVKMKHRRNLSNASLRSKEPDEYCFFGRTLNLFQSIYLESQEDKLTMKLLDVILGIGTCNCIDNDQLLGDILKRIDQQHSDVVSKALNVAANFIEQGIPELMNKACKVRQGSSKSRNSSRKKDSSLTRLDVNEASQKSDDITDGNSDSYIFLHKYKHLISSSDPTCLALLENHLSKIVSRSQGILQLEIFKKIVLPILAFHIPANCSETALKSESTSLLKKCLHFLPLFLDNDEAFQAFAQKNGMLYLETLGKNVELGPLAFDSLQRIVSRHSQRVIPSTDSKSVRIFKDPSPKTKATVKVPPEFASDAVSLKAIDSLLACGKKLLESKVNNPGLDHDENSTDSKLWDNFLKLLAIFTELQVTSMNFQDQFSKTEWPQICWDLMNDVLKSIECTLESSSSDRSDLATPQLEPNIKSSLPTFRAVLPICLRSAAEARTDDVQCGSLEETLAMFAKSWMHPRVIESHFGKDVCTCLLECAAKPVKMHLHVQPIDASKMVRAQSLLDKDDEASDANMEEEGYDADTESEIEHSTRAEATSGHSHSTRSPLTPDKPQSATCRGHDVPAVHSVDIQFPEVCAFVLQSISDVLQKQEASANLSSLKETLRVCLVEILSFVQGSPTNCMLLSTKGSLKLLVGIFGTIVTFKDGDFTGIEEMIGKIVVLLSASAITADEFKSLVQLFKCDDAPLDLLSRIVNDMAKAASTSAGATYSLMFPVEPEQPVQTGKAASVQQSHTFLIPKRDGSAKNRSILRQRTIPSGQVAGSGPKSYGYRLQTSSTEIAPVQLPLQDSFKWPDMGFSIALWFKINDNHCIEVLAEDGKGTGRQNQEIRKVQRQSQSTTSSSNDSFNVDESMVFHVCSLGGQNALFEIWLSASQMNIEYRWLVSQSGENEGNFSNFDQVILPSSVPVNTWNHLVVTLALPQNLAQPRTATVMTFLNGCEEMQMSMKFPSRCMQNNVKLSMLLGHAVRTKKHVTTPRLESTLKLQIGNSFLFQGSESFSSQQNSNAGFKKNECRKDSVVGRAQAVYLYALGPDAFHMTTECGDRLKMPMSSHMDSSLNWDSMHFKEMSFAMNIITEELIAAEFPVTLLVDVKSQLPAIQTALQDGLVLKYSPRRPSEFCQYITHRTRSTSLSSVITKEETVTRTYVELSNSQAIMNVKVSPYYRKTLQQAVHDAGGVANLLYLFAKVSEDVNTEYAQSMILHGIFMIIEKSPYLLREMNDLAGYILLHRVLESSLSQLGFHIVKALLNSMCDGIILIEPDDKHGGFLEIKATSTAVVKNVLILQTLVMDWKIWSDAPLIVQETLWQALQSLVRSNHPRSAFNTLQFKRARVVEKLLFGLQEREQNCAGVVPPTLGRLYISVIKDVLGQPPDMPILKAICSFLIASHPTINTLTLHSRGNFYLMPKTPSIPIKTTRTSLRPTPRRNSNERQRRCYSFTEGFMGEASSTDSIVGIFSNMGSSPGDSITGDNDSFPRSEVLFRKDHKDMKRILFAKIDEHLSLANSSDESSRASSNTSLNVHRKRYPLIASQSVDEVDASAQPKCSTPVSAGKVKSDSETLTIDDIAREKIGACPVSRNVTLLKAHRRNRSLDINLKLPSMLMKMDSQEYDIISDSELPSSLDQCSDEYLVVDGLIGQKVGSFTPTAPNGNEEQGDTLFYVRLGLFEMLQDVLTLLPDNLITRIFGTILKVEHLLVMVNQQNGKLREIAVKNLSLYLQRGGKDCVNNFKRFKGFYLLANQLHQYPSSISLANHCLNLMTDRLIAIKDGGISKDFTVENPIALAAYLSLLEDAIQHPNTCHTLVTTLIQIFTVADGLILVAFDQLFPEIICNMVCMLATSDNGSLTSKWKVSVFNDILDLISWIVKKATMTCEAVYFQTLKDLLLAIQMLESKEREEKGTLSSVIVKSARFIQYFVLSTVLELFTTTGFYLATSRPASASAYSLSESGRRESGSTITRRPSKARAFVNKFFRSSMRVITSPSVASPSEIQERFLYIINEAVVLATLFSKSTTVCESNLFGRVLQQLSSAGHGATDAKPVALSHDADMVFSCGLLSYLLETVHICLDLQTVDMNRTILLRGAKDDLVGQTSRLLIYLISPVRKLEVRVAAMQQIVQLQESRKIMHTLLQGISGLKNRERLLSCIGVCLKYKNNQLTEDQAKTKESMKMLMKLLKVEIVDVAEQQLYQEIREIKTRRQKQLLTQRKESYKRKTDQATQLSEEIALQGMEVTQTVVEEQDRQRQRLLQLVRGSVSKKVEVKKLWRKLITQLTQERALWSECPDHCSPSWQLDPTEGPSRVRIRLQRCHTDIPSKFFMSSTRKSKLPYHEQKLSYLFLESCNDDQPTYYTFKTNDTIRFHYHCHRVTPDAKTQGDVLIGETHMYFVGEEILDDQNQSQVIFGDKDVISISWRYEEIKEILKRRYSLQDNAVEIFLTSGRTFLLAFEDTKCRDELCEQLNSRELPNLVTDAMDLNTLTIRWKEGYITNFEYLTELNKKAGRSFNDLMQYPVFPFILAEYEGASLDINDQASFRDLSKPIAVQHETKKEKYLQTYNWLQEEYERRMQDDPEEATLPYHYGSHYSNSGTVLHFLVRMPPFTKMFLMYQDNQFDIPDRTFHSLFTTWHLSSFASSSDVKEMIPEFFFFPEFLQNSEGYNFGCRQNAERVHDVTLPPWTPNNDARLFVNIHRQALESHCVSSALHHWIDLVFGYKQDGPAAKAAVNVFHPATYFGVDVGAVKDHLKRRALQTMIETYGQTPRKLFTTPHVQRFSKTIVSPLSEMMPSLPQAVENLVYSTSNRDRVTTKSVFQEPHDGIQPLATVSGLSWGRYCGSPSQTDPAMQWVESFKLTPETIQPSNKSSMAFVVDQKCCLVMPEEDCTDHKRMGCFSWKDDDTFLIVKSLATNKKIRFDTARPDKITCCAFVPGADLLFVGGSSGMLSAWPVHFYPEPISLEIVGVKQNLIGHSGAITSIFVCRPYSIVVTGSEDSVVIIWDLNRLSYVRCLPKHESKVSCLSVSKTSGNIATACAHGDNGSFLHLWTINAKGIWKTSTESKINCIDFSCAPEGISVNVVAAGLQNGIIRLWSTWTLMCIRDIQPPSGSCPVVCLAYSPWDPHHLYSCDNQGNVCLWTRKDLSLKPTFIPVSLS